MARVAGPYSLVKDQLAFLFDAGNLTSYNNSSPSNARNIIGPFTGTKDSSVGFDTEQKGTLTFPGTAYNSSIPSTSTRVRFSSTNMDYTTAFSFVIVSKFTFDTSIRTIINVTGNPSSVNDNSNFTLQQQRTQDGPDGGFRFRISSGYRINYDAPSTLNLDNTWHAITLTVLNQTGGDKVLLYVDKNQVASATLFSTITSTVNEVNIGRDNFNSGTLPQCKGSIAYVAGYNKVLSQAEVIQNYNLLSQRYNLI